MSRRWALVVLVGVVVVGALVARDQVRSLERDVAATDACAAASEGQWADAIGLAEPLLEHDDEAGRIAFECWCLAHLLSGDARRCTEALDEAIDARAPWLPDTALVTLLVDQRIRRGRLASAEALARRGLQERPLDPDLTLALARARLTREPPERVLTEAVGWPVSDPGRYAIELAWLAIERDEPTLALKALSRQPPPALAAAWMRARGAAFAALGRADALAETLEQATALGVPEALTRAYHVELSVRFHLPMPGGQSEVETLAGALAGFDPRLADDKVWPFLFDRIGIVLAGTGEAEGALRWIRKGRSLLGDRLTLDEQAIASAGRVEELARRQQQGLTASEPGRIELVAPAGFTGTVRISPPAAAPVNAPYVERPLAPGQPASFSRVPVSSPVRWVLVDDEDRIRGSGAVWPAPSRTVTVRPSLRAPPAPSSPRALPRPGPADGRRRLFAVLVDAGDWRIVRYLDARGELSTFRRLMTEGVQAVLWSDPPATAVAVDRVVRGRPSSGLTAAERLTIASRQLGMLSDDRSSPFDSLELLTRRRPSLFERLRERGASSANLLLARGGIRTDTAQTVMMADGAIERLLARRRRRPLTEGERRRFPGVLDRGREDTQEWAEEIAADFDAALALAHRKDVDVTLLHVDGTDRAAHLTLSTFLDAGQDDGETFLAELYRYLDHRLGELWSALDEDDVLVVFSDHGMKTPMAHDPRALFLAAGADLELLRVDGRPPIDVVPAFILSQHKADGGSVAEVFSSGRDDEPTGP